jgi:hypothetical protein
MGFPGFGLIGRVLRRFGFGQKFSNGNANDLSNMDPIKRLKAREVRHRRRSHSGRPRARRH